jgi:hypothetical protein
MDDSNGFRAVAPIRPAAAYIGGKRRLGEQLARRIEAVAHETYAEPFVGMGGSGGDGRPGERSSTTSRAMSRRCSASCSGTIRNSWKR